MPRGERREAWGILGRAGHSASNPGDSAAEWALRGRGRLAGAAICGKMSQAPVGRFAAGFYGITGSLEESMICAEDEKRGEGWQRACDEGGARMRRKSNARIGPQACRAVHSGEGPAVRHDDRQLRLVAGAKPHPPAGGLGSPALSLLLISGLRALPAPPGPHDW